MIDSISGKLMKKSPAFAVIDVNGIRLKIHVSLSTYERLPEAGTNAQLLTYLHVREDILDLYGFSHEDQRDVFLLLIGISGIGPRSAMGILSGATIDEFKKRIIAGDVKSLTIIPGIGSKTAKRIIIELKEKFVTDKDEDISTLMGSGDVPTEMLDAVDALIALGYKRSQALAAMKKLEKKGDLTGSVELLIKKALSHM